jgi:hypothetical protein
MIMSKQMNGAEQEEQKCAQTLVHWLNPSLSLSSVMNALHRKDARETFRNRVGMHALGLDHKALRRANRAA